MAKIVLVLLGGAFGTGIRYLLSSLIYSRRKDHCPSPGDRRDGAGRPDDARERPGAPVSKRYRPALKGASGACKCPVQNNLSAVGLALCIFVTISGHHRVLYCGEGGTTRIESTGKSESPFVGRIFACSS